MNSTENGWAEHKKKKSNKNYIFFFFFFLIHAIFFSRIHGDFMRTHNTVQYPIGRRAVRECDGKKRKKKRINKINKIT